MFVFDYITEKRKKNRDNLNTLLGLLLSRDNELEKKRNAINSMIFQIDHDI